MKKYLLHIGGQAVAPASGEWFESINPYTGKPWALIPRGTRRGRRSRGQRGAHGVHVRRPWPKLTASQRGALLRKLGDLIGAAREARSPRSKCATTAS